MAGTRPRVLVKTSIPFTEDDWHVGRFSLVTKELARWADVTARNRQPGPDGDDPVLAGLAENDAFDELIVAFERHGPVAGRAVAHSSFHHFADLNWNPALGAPSFVTEVAGDAVARDPHLLDDVRRYVRSSRRLAPARRGLRRRPWPIPARTSTRSSPSSPTPAAARNA